MSISVPRIRALHVLRDEEEAITARQFAKRMWPDSSGWKTTSNVRNGAVRGKAMPGLAGRMLWGLWESGWVRIERSRWGQSFWAINREGREVLNAYDKGVSPTSQ